MNNNIGKAITSAIQKQNQALKAYAFSTWDDGLDEDVIRDGIVQRLTEAGIPLEGTAVTTVAGVHTLVLAGKFKIRYHEDMPFCEIYTPAMAGVFTYKECDTLYKFFTRVYKPE